jgi:hypothetical protein
MLTAFRKNEEQRFTRMIAGVSEALRSVDKACGKE